MMETRLLRRIIHYIWECYRSEGEMKMRLRNHKGDELHVEEQSETLTVSVIYYAKRPQGELVNEMEVICFILRHGAWVPLELGKGGRREVYARANADTGQVAVLDADRQLGAALFCDAWALRLLEEGFLASAAKLNPLPLKPTQRPNWPKPTVPPPSLEQIEEWMWDDHGCEATDGTWVEIDGIAPSGHPSWLLRLGLV